MINSPFSPFEVTNLIEIFAPILGKFNIILTNLAICTNIFDFFSLFLNFYTYCKEIFTIFTIVMLCGIIYTGVGNIVF